MKVLHVISGLDRRSGGPPIALAGLAQAQATAGLEVVVATSWHVGETMELAQAMEGFGVRVVPIGPCHGKLQRCPQLEGELRSLVRKADVVHIHALWEEIQHLAARVSHDQGIPYGISPHGMLDPWSLRQHWIRKRLYMKYRLRQNLNQAAFLHFTSQTERDLTLPLGLKSDSVVEPNGIDLSEFEHLPEKGSFRSRYPEIGNRPLILFLSRLHHKKGLDLLIPAFGRLKNKEAVLVIAGPDAEGYQTKLVDLVQKEGLGSRVIFTGMLYGRQRIEALADADLFALPSYQENFGIAVVEALAAGTPVIISDQVNIQKEILEGKVGAVVPTQVAPLAAELERWLEDAVLRKSATDRARPFVWDRYDWNQIAKGWGGVYQGYCNKGGGSLSAPLRLARDSTGPTRILHVISSLDPSSGGPVAALLGLAKAQKNAGLDVSVVATWRNHPKNLIVDQLMNAGIHLDLVGPTHGRLDRHPDIASVVSKAADRADLVHIHALWEEVQHQAVLAAQTRGLPYIIRPCGMLDPWSLRQHWIRKRLYMKYRLRQNLNHASFLHFTSQTERDLTLPLGLKSDSVVEPNGIDLSEFEQLPEKGSFRSRYPEIGNRPLIVFLSRLHHKKGLDLLIPAFGRLKNKEAMLVIAGPDADGYQTKLADLVKKEKLGSRVIFTGMLYGRQRIEALADADLFALPSYQENFGIAVVEALAAGTPVIISDQVNIQKEILEGKVGAVVPTQIAPLAAELGRWLGDATLRKAATDRARPFVWDRYDWNQIAGRWKGRYAALLGDRADSTSKEQMGAA